MKRNVVLEKFGEVRRSENPVFQNPEPAYWKCVQPKFNRECHKTTVKMS